MATPFFHIFRWIRIRPKRRPYFQTYPPGTVFVTGVSGTGAVGALTPSIAVNTGGITGVAATGVAGGVLAPSVNLVGVFGTGVARDVFPIVPPPAHRPPLFIPQDSLGTPASIWLGS